MKPDNKRNEERLALWDKWLLLNNSSSENLMARITEIFAGFNKAACEQLSADAARFARLGDKDEAIYMHLQKLMGVYKAVIGMADEAVDECPGVTTLLNGLCEVLISRLTEFDDLTEPNAPNPVTQEKKGIIDGALFYVSRGIENIQQQFIKHMQEDKPSEWSALCVGASFISIEELTAQECFPMIYNHYQEGLRFCLSGLDDLHARKTARLYTELIEREWEELGNIIRVQVLHLEAATKEVSIEEAPVANKILDKLRELYQHTGPIIDELQRLLNTPPSKTPLTRSYREFSGGLEKVLEKNKDDNTNSKAFLDALAAESYALFDQIKLEFMKAAYQLQRTISGELLLADEITEAFVKAKETLAKETLETVTTQPPPEMTPEEASIQKDILKGITETIEIKIESLRDSFQEFNNNSLKVVKNFSQEMPHIPEDERLTAIEKVSTLWMTSPPTDFSQLPEFFNKCWNGEAFSPTREHVSRQIKTYFDKIEKSVFNFKKEVLLYEVCTYEEILTHSVSRLRTSPWQEAVHAAALLDNTFKNLEVHLKKNNILVIRPNPHEPFNATEHEVLIAEKQPGFNKGEIIKILTSGYKQKEQVIIRANVVAAR